MSRISAAGLLGVAALLLLAPSPAVAVLRRAGEAPGQVQSAPTAQASGASAEAELVATGATGQNPLQELDFDELTLRGLAFGPDAAIGRGKIGEMMWHRGSLHRGISSGVRNMTPRAITV